MRRSVSRPFERSAQCSSAERGTPSELLEIYRRQKWTTLSNCVQSSLYILKSNFFCHCKPRNLMNSFRSNIICKDSALSIHTHIHTYVHPYVLKLAYLYP